MTARVTSSNASRAPGPPNAVSIAMSRRSHGRDAHAAIPGSRFETLPRAAHFPHLEDPEGLAAVLRDFLETTESGQIDDGDWGDLVTGRLRRTRPMRHIAA